MFFMSQNWKENVKTFVHDEVVKQNITDITTSTTQQSHHHTLPSNMTTFKQ